MYHLQRFFFLFFSFLFLQVWFSFDIAGLPLRSCWTIGLPSVGGVSQCLIFVSGHSRIRTHVLVIAMQTSYHCATLTLHNPKPFVHLV